MREIIRKERKLYAVLHFCAFCYGISIAVMCAILALIASTEVFSMMQDFYQQAESMQFLVANFMLAGIVGVGLAMLYSFIERCWFKTFFSNFEHECTAASERYHHWPLCTGFWISFVATISAIICACVLVTHKFLVLPIESVEKLRLILIVPFVIAALCVLIIGFVTHMTKRALRRCYKRLGYNI